MKRTIHFVVAALLSGPVQAAVVTPPAILSMTSGDVFLQYAGPGVPNTILPFPVFGEITVGGSHAFADLGIATLKDSSFAADTGLSRATVANSGLRVQFQNTGAAPVLFAAGAISASISATFARTLGALANTDTTETDLTAVLSGSVPGFPSGSASVRYQYVESHAATSPFFDSGFSVTPGFTASGTADATSLSALLAFPAFTLDANQRMDLLFQLTTTAIAGQLGGSGWSALTDAASSGSLSMVLPSGVTVVSGVPLTWITTAPVPLPAAIWLFGAGITTLFGFGQTRKSRCRVRREFRRTALSAEIDPRCSWP